MIRFALSCDKGHRFESWFASGAAFDELTGRGLVACSACGSTGVGKAIMAPAVVTERPAPSRGEERPRLEVSLLDERRSELRRLAKALREKIIAETQDVGARFPDEARRMHEGEIPHREIRGEATPDEARSLLKDGVMILPLPAAPDDFN